MAFCMVVAEVRLAHPRLRYHKSLRGCGLGCGLQAVGFVPRKLATLHVQAYV